MVDTGAFDYPPPSVFMPAATNSDYGLTGILGCFFKAFSHFFKVIRMN
jgi:hypothetical protein